MSQVCRRTYAIHQAVACLEMQPLTRMQLSSTRSSVAAQDTAYSDQVEDCAVPCHARLQTNHHSWLNDSWDKLNGEIVEREVMNASRVSHRPCSIACAVCHVLYKAMRSTHDAAGCHAGHAGVSSCVS